MPLRRLPPHRRPRQRCKMTVTFDRLSKIFNALTPNTVNKSPRLLFFEHGWFGVAKLPRPLDEAIRDRDHAEVERLLAKGANPNLSSHFSGPALKEAVTTGDLSLVKLIVEKGGDINGVNTANATALHAAISDLRGRPEQQEVMEYLLSQNPRLDIKSSAGDTPLEWARQLGDEKGERILAKASGTDTLDELKPFLQADGSYQFKATMKREPNYIKIVVPDFRNAEFYADIKDEKVSLYNPTRLALQKATDLFGLADAKIAYRGNAKDGFKMNLVPASVWRAQEAQLAESQRLFDDLLQSGLPTAEDVQPLKPISFKPKANPPGLT